MIPADLRQPVLIIMRHDNADNMQSNARLLDSSQTEKGALAKFFLHAPLIPQYAA